MNKRIKRNIFIGIILILNITMILIVGKSYNSDNSIQCINEPGSKVFFLDKNHSVIQTFFSYQNTVEKVGIYTSAQNGNGVMKLRIYDNNTSKEYFSDIIEINNQETKINFLKLKIPIKNAKGHEYYMEFENISDSRIEILLSDKNNTDGHLLKDGKELENDLSLLLKYNYQNILFYCIFLFIIINYK